ncbi:MAG: hypothetical protein AUG83_07330 [Acidobacteria bacterium 13_1_20CM_4_57_11]|nr:MAG: hypothetical protein AUG83_07330 [Acidobacteria bacterium 13_1_20CM_4_57_11]
MVFLESLELVEKKEKLKRAYPTPLFLRKSAELNEKKRDRHLKRKRVRKNMKRKKILDSWMACDKQRDLNGDPFRARRNYARAF